MNNFLNQLNLTAQERRIVVIIFLVVIIVLNLLFVWPHFGDWGSINKQLEDMRGKIVRYNGVILQDTNPTNGYKVQVNKLSRLEGGSVMEHPVDPQIQLGNTIRAQEHKTGVYVGNYGTASTKTDEFFETISTSIDVESEEPQLVNFLYNMGMDPAMIRVARLDLKPADANRYKLKGGITLTANYTKPAAAGASVAARPAAGSKPPSAPPHTPAAASSNKPPLAPGNRPGPGPGNKPASIPFNRPASPLAPGQAGQHPPNGFPQPGFNRQPPGAWKTNLPQQTHPSRIWSTPHRVPGRNNL